MKLKNNDIRLIAEGGGQSLVLISLPLAVPGFSNFLSSWLIRTPEGTVLVDCGVAGSYPYLKKALDSLGISPDLLLLTHIHLDHCGAAGYLCRDFPGMKVFCFERAAKHLINPEKLWNATAATLGTAMAEAYQPPLPVPAQNIITREQLPAAWQVIDTPGHAPHHVSFLVNLAGQRVCFGGEALGVVAGRGAEDWFRDGVRRTGIRPATPPKYIPEIGRASMKKLAAGQWDLFCCAHGGAVTDRTLPERALKQNQFWEKEIAAGLEKGLSEQQMIQLMVRDDPELADLAFYTEENHQREIYFIGNSVRGFVRFLTEQKQDA